MFVCVFVRFVVLLCCGVQGQRGTTKKGVPIMYDIEDKINFAVFPGESWCPTAGSCVRISTIYDIMGPVLAGCYSYEYTASIELVLSILVLLFCSVMLCSVLYCLLLV